MIKKLLFLIFVLSCITKANAFFCTDITSGQGVGIGSLTILEVPLDPDLVSGNTGIVNEYADVNSYIVCQNEAPEVYTDWLFMTSFTTPLNPAVAFGVQINGVNYFESLPGNVLVLEFPRGDAASFPLPLKLVMKVGDRPTNGVFIKKGDELMTMHMLKYAYIGSDTTPIDENTFIWKFIAANDIILPAGTCDINDGQLMVVDLGTVRRSRISGPGTGATSEGAQDVELTYQCKNNNGSIDTNYNANIRLYLSAAPSSFSGNAVEVKKGSTAGTGNLIPYLGMEFYHRDSGKLLAPSNQVSGYFNSQIRNGRGGPDTLRIGLVKDPNTLPENIAEGAFNAVATIIMTLD